MATKADVVKKVETSFNLKCRKLCVFNPGFKYQVWTQQEREEEKLKIRDFLEDPASSKAAAVYHRFVGLCIVVSVCCVLFETIPDQSGKQVRKPQIPQTGAHIRSHARTPKPMRTNIINLPIRSPFSTPVKTWTRCFPIILR